MFIPVSFTTQHRKHKQSHIHSLLKIHQLCPSIDWPWVPTWYTSAQHSKRSIGGHAKRRWHSSTPSYEVNGEDSRYIKASPRDNYHFGSFCGAYATGCIHCTFHGNFLRRLSKYDFRHHRDHAFADLSWCSGSTVLNSFSTFHLVSSLQRTNEAQRPPPTSLNTYLHQPHQYPPMHR